MKKDIVERLALDSATEALKRGRTDLKAAKRFAAAILDLCDGHGDDVPMEQLLKLQTKFPTLFKPFLKGLEEEAQAAQTSRVKALRKDLKKSN